MAQQEKKAEDVPTYSQFRGRLIGVTPFGTMKHEKRISAVPDSKTPEQLGETMLMRARSFYAVLEYTAKREKYNLVLK